jgi:hypothetical protein
LHNVKTINKGIAFYELERGNKTFEQFKKEFEDVWVSQFWNPEKIVKLKEAYLR